MELSKVKQIIKALQEKTTAQGCTEAEAVAAAAKCAELMKKHQLTDELLTTGFVEAPLKTVRSNPRDLLWRDLAYFTNTRLLRMPEERSSRFYGAEPWPEIAAYLKSVLDRAIDTAAADFKTDSFYRARRTTKTRKKAVEDFTIGMVSRLRGIVAEYFRETRDRRLLDVAETAMKTDFPQTKLVKSSQKKTRFHSATVHGWEAGDKVELKHGLSREDNSPVGLLGHD